MRKERTVLTYLAKPFLVTGCFDEGDEKPNEVCERMRLCIHGEELRDSVKDNLSFASGCALPSHKAD
jgi:hypothetical protein